jgi:hypothetical protein
MYALQVVINDTQAKEVAATLPSAKAGISLSALQGSLSAISTQVEADTGAKIQSVRSF